MMTANGSRAARVWMLVAGLVAVNVASTVRAVAQQVRNEPALCWTPEVLAARAQENEIRRGTREAIVAPPKGTPVAFTPVPADKRLAIRRVQLPPGQKLVALTFDLCEQPGEIAGYQGIIVDTLRREKVKATFFAGGKWMLTHRERAEQLMSDTLFEMGNHGWEHRNLRLFRGAALATEITGPQLAYEQVRHGLGTKQCVGANGRQPFQGSAPRLSLFRFPYGACDAASLEAVGEMGLRAIQWDVSSGDPWPLQTADRMTKAVLANVRPGSIVLFHANGRGWHTPEAIRAVVTGLKAKGYGFVTVSELLAAGEPVYSRTCYDARPGDTDRYDTVALKRPQPAKAPGGIVTEVHKEPR